MHWLSLIRPGDWLMMLAGLGLDELAHPLAQAVGLHAAGVDAVAEAGNRFKQFLLAADGFFQRLPSCCQRVPATRFGVALEQRFLVGMQEQEGRADAVLGELAQFFREQFDAVSGAGIDRHRDLARLFFLEHADEHRQHNYRQIVYAVIARIFEQIEGNRFAGAGETTDENEFHALQHNQGGACKQPSA